MGYFDRPRLYLQTDYRLDRKMNKSGCAIRSLIAVPEIFLRKRLEIVDIEEIAIQSLDMGYIDPDYAFHKPGKIVELAYEKYGKEVTCYDIATRKGSKTHYYKWVQASGIYDHTFTLLKWKTDGEQGMHFTLGDKDGKEIFDPYPVDVHKVLEYEILMRLIDEGV